MAYKGGIPGRLEEKTGDGRCLDLGGYRGSSAAVSPSPALVDEVAFRGVSVFSKG